MQVQSFSYHKLGNDLAIEIHEITAFGHDSRKYYLHTKSPLT